MDITSFVVGQRNKALLVGDYGSYRKQLSRRLLVVRKKLNYVSSTSKGHKYASKPRITTEDLSSKPEFIHLLLLSSERAWAHAVHMKSLHAAESGTQGIAGSTRRHIASRLHKASSYAGQLVELFKSGRDSGVASEAVLEARAYHLLMRGTIDFEKKNWEKSLHEYSEAHFIYGALGRSGGGKHSDIFRELTTSTIDPGIRYAAYQLKLPRTTSIDKIVSLYLQRSDNEYVGEVLKLYPEAGVEGSTRGTVLRENAQDLPQTIQWRSRTVNLEDAAIAQTLGAVAAAQEKLAGYLSSNPDLETKAKASAYDDILIASQDAVDATKTAIDELTAEGVSPGDRRMQALQITRTSVNYTLVGWRIGRNRVLCGSNDGAILENWTSRKPRKPRKGGSAPVAQTETKGRKLARLKERVVLLDATLQSLESVKNLPGVAADDEFLKELESKRAYFASLKRVSRMRKIPVHEG
jgi:signal recognition particle subunit SRP68